MFILKLNIRAADFDEILVLTVITRNLAEIQMHCISKTYCNRKKKTQKTQTSNSLSLSLVLWVNATFSIFHNEKKLYLVLGKVYRAYMRSFEWATGSYREKYRNIIMKQRGRKWLVISYFCHLGRTSIDNMFFLSQRNMFSFVSSQITLIGGNPRRVRFVTFR